MSDAELEIVTDIAIRVWQFLKKENDLLSMEAIRARILAKVVAEAELAALKGAR